MIMETSKVLLPIFKHSWYAYKLSYVRIPSIGLLSVLRRYSTQNTQDQEVLATEKIQLQKPAVVKWKRPPFVKNLFLGKFDTELLAFPEILNNEQLTELEIIVKNINELYANKVNSLEIDEKKSIPNEVLQDLKDLGLFGRRVPATYGGLDLTYTACIRLNEVLGLNWSLCATLAAHEFLASQVLLISGTEEQKRKYLPDLASGRCIAALCCSEIKSGCDLLSMSTTAEYNTDGSCFVLDGTKSWVTNAELADYYIVFAKTTNTLASSDAADEISVLLVDRNSEGITVESQEKTSLCGLKTGTVHFKETSVPVCNLLGIHGHGYQVFLKTLESFRFVLSSFTFGTLKVLLDSITEYVINTERVERSLGDIQLVRERLSKINTTIYAMESMAYFTAAIFDSTENPDIALESAILKIFNSEGTLFCIRELMHLLGSSSLFKEQQLERFHRDAQALAMFEGSNDIARLYIGLTGCKFVGSKRAEDVVKMRNTAFFPKEHMKRSLKRVKLSYGFVKYDQDLGGHVHPSLVGLANDLEENLQRFNVAVESTMTLHGRKIVDTQLDPKRLANVAIDLYATTAVLARSSRSYCIGLKNADHEIRVASSFCYDTSKRIKAELQSIFQGVGSNNDGNNLILGEQVIDCRGYFCEHPLKHNF